MDTLINAVSSLLTQIAQNRVFYAIFRILRFLDYRKVKTNLKNIQATIIDVKFDEESKSELKIGLPCNDKPGNRKILPNKEGKFRKIKKKRLPLFPNPHCHSEKFSIQKYT